MMFYCLRLSPDIQYREQSSVDSLDVSLRQREDTEVLLSQGMADTPV